MFAILGFIFNAIVACVVFFLIIAVWQIAKRLYNRSSLRRAKVARSSTYPLYRQTNYRIPYSSGTSRDTSSLASNNVTVSVSAKDDSFDDSFLDDDPTLHETDRRDDDYSPSSYSSSSSSKSSLSYSCNNDTSNDSDDCNSDEISDYDDSGDYDYDCDDDGHH